MLQRKYTWQDFTEAARRALTVAFNEAARLGAPDVSSAQMLLALVQDGTSVAMLLLAERRVDIDRLKTELREQVGHGGRGRADGELSYAKNRVLTSAYEHSRGLRTTYIGTEHLLLGILTTSDRKLFRLLRRVGVNRTELVALINSYSAARHEYPLEQYTDAARLAMENAGVEARKCGMPALTCGTLVVGLIKDRTNVATFLLEATAVDTVQLEAEVRRRLRTGDSSPPEDMLPDSDLSRAVGRAHGYGTLLSARYLGTEHLLLGLLGLPTHETDEPFRVTGASYGSVRAIVDSAYVRCSTLL